MRTTTSKRVQSLGRVTRQLKTHVISSPQPAQTNWINTLYWHSNRKSLFKKRIQGVEHPPRTRTSSPFNNLANKRHNYGSSAVPSHCTFTYTCRCTDCTHHAYTHAYAYTHHAEWMCMHIHAMHDAHGCTHSPCTYHAHACTNVDIHMLVHHRSAFILLRTIFFGLFATWYSLLRCFPGLPT